MPPFRSWAAALVLGVAGVVSFTAASQAAAPSPAKSHTLVFKVVFSPFEPVQANNVRNPHSRFALGDEIVAHDQLFSHGRHAGDDALSCVIVAVPPDITLANCTGIFRLPSGTIAFQTTAIPGPKPKDLAVTGGTGIYRNAGGEGTLVEFGNGKGRLTIHVLSLVARGG
jgi:Allene oxide cyclase barrel like domain